MSLLQVRDLSVIANNAGHDVTLVDRVSFDLAEGEILGLVGESGSGKTMACRGLTACCHRLTCVCRAARCAWPVRTC